MKDIYHLRTEERELQTVQVYIDSYWLSSFRKLLAAKCCGERGSIIPKISGKKTFLTPFTSFSVPFVKLCAHCFHRKYPEPGTPGQAKIS